MGSHLRGSSPRFPNMLLFAEIRCGHQGRIVYFLDLFGLALAPSSRLDAFSGASISRVPWEDEATTKAPDFFSPVHLMKEHPPDRFSGFIKVPGDAT